MTSFDKLKPLFLHYDSPYGHETWKDAALSLRASNHKVTQSSDHMALKIHMTNTNHYIFMNRVNMVTKLGRMVAQTDGLLPIK